MLAVRSAKRVLVHIGPFERFAREQLVDRPLLKLNRVSLTPRGDVHELGCKARITVMVDAAFRDYETRLAVTHETLTNANGARIHHAVQPPSTMRFAPVM